MLVRSARRPVSAGTLTSHSLDSGNRFGGLDGLRAIAVGMVLIYHLFPKALPGGFLGVDVFFVISGFLITSLMLREHAKYGRISLVSFWKRRARRLLPAVALVVLVSSSLALAGSRDLLVGIGRQIAGAVFFVSNWVFVSSGTDYFERDTPELFRNFWSLAVEEQFYIVLPLLAVVLFRLRRSGTRAIPLLLIGLGSAALMVSMAQGGTDPTRIYFGSDSHSFGMMLGAAMAVMLEPIDRRAVGVPGQVATLATAILGFAGLGVLAFTLGEGSLESFLGGFQVATVLSIAVVWAVTRKDAWVGKALDVQPLRWIGERSYGLYLWHWPLLLILSSVVPASWSASGWVVPASTLGFTVVFAAVSYRYLEQPVRRHGLRGSLRLWFSPRVHTRHQRRIAFTFGGIFVAGFIFSAIAIVIAPAQTTSAATILRGQELLEADRAQTAPAVPDEAPSREDSRGASADPRTDLGDPRSESTTSKDPKDGSAAIAPLPDPITISGGDITAVGDSVMLASYPELSEAFPGIEVDAAVSRGMWAGVEILDGIQANSALRSVVVVGLSTNGPVDTESLEEIQRIVGNRPIVLVNAHAERDWIAPANATLEQFAEAHAGVTIARWTEGIAPHPEFLAGDGIHPGPEGGEIYAQALRDAFAELAEPGEALGWAVPRR